MAGGRTTVKEFKKMIADIPETYDNYSVIDQGGADLEWVGLTGVHKGLIIEFGNHPDEYPVKVEVLD